MKMIAVQHSRRKVGMDAATRRALSVDRKTLVVLRGPASTVREKVYKVPASAANLRKILAPEKCVVFVSKTMLQNLGVQSGSTIDVLTESQARTTPPALPHRPRGAVAQATGGTIGAIRSVLGDHNRGDELTTAEIRDKVQAKHGQLLGDISSTLRSLKDRGELVDTGTRGLHRVGNVLTPAESEV